MNTEQRVLILRYREQQNNLLYWPAQIKALLKAKLVRHVGQGDDAASSHVSNLDITDVEMMGREQSWILSSKRMLLNQ